MMLSPKVVQVLFTAVAVLFTFTLLNHTLSSDESDDYTGFDGSAAPPPAAKPYGGASSFISHVTEKVSPWLGGNSLSQHIQKNEQMYNEMLEQRKELYKDYDKTPDPLNKDLFPCNSADAYWKTPFTIWDFLPAAWNCPHEVRRIGRMGDGGKWICGLEQLVSLPRSRKSSQRNELGLKAATPASGSNTLPPGEQPGCVVYSFGIQFESTFEEQLIERTPNCQIWGYDYSVDKFGPALKGYEAQNRAFFTQAGIAGTTDMQSSPQMYSIQDLMAINGHDHIDVLKMDIEGYEFESMRSVIEHFLDKGEEVPIAQLLVEIHLDPGRISVDDFLDWWELLEKAGFRPTWTEPNLLVSTLPLHDARPRYAEYSLINIKDKKGPLF